MVFDDESISYIDCHEWFVFGGCNESGKKNDWIFHNAAINYILKFYTSTMPQLQIWDVWTDNGPGQVSSEGSMFYCNKDLALFVYLSSPELVSSYHYHVHSTKTDKIFSSVRRRRSIIPMFKNSTITLQNSTASKIKVIQLGTGSNKVSGN
jgi:hypothetical protein